MSDDSARGIAREIAREHDTRLIEVRDHDYAGRRHRVAEFERAGRRFTLVPGDRVTLGYDGARFTPSPEQEDDYARSAEEYGLPPLNEFVDTMTSPTRVVDVPALLVAVDPIALPAGDRFEPVTHEFAVREAAAAGLRPTTPDEWEYACGAGATTLFRWGDDSPADDYPVKREGPHREPNLWGLAIGQDPYRHESTSVPTVICGGDGGCATCGGCGFFVGWLALATAYRDQDLVAMLYSGEGYVDELLLRPVIDLT